MSFLYSDILLSLLKNKLILLTGGAAVAVGVSTPIALKVASSIENKTVVPQKQLDSIFTQESLNKLIDHFKSNMQQDDSKWKLQSWPSEEDIKTFLVALLKVNNYREMDSTSLTKEERQSLLSVFRLYAELERSKMIESKKDGSTTLQFSESLMFLDGLFELSWNQDKVRLAKDSSLIDNKWGWNSWDSKNPFWFVYEKDEGKWSEKMKMLVIDQSKWDYKMEREMEYKISSWMLKDMVRIHKSYMN